MVYILSMEPSGISEQAPNFLTARIQPHPGFRAVGRKMYDIAFQFAGYVEPEFIVLSLTDAVHFVHSLGYRSDDSFDENLEVLMRPDAITGPIDCKKMCIMLAAWAISNNKPFRFVAVAEADQNNDGVVDYRDIHHVIILIYDRELPYLIDPTRNLDVQEPLYAEIL